MPNGINEKVMKKTKVHMEADIEDLKSKIKSSGSSYLLDPNEEVTDEYAHFYFLGTHGGEEVIFDAILYTLRLQHESELFQQAEKKAVEKFPQYKKIQYEEDESGKLILQNELEEAIGLYMAEVMMCIEEEGSLKLKEHIDWDSEHNFGIGLDIGLHIEKVTPAVISKFVNDFNTDKLKLDPTLYSFQTHPRNS
jgi:hypothetical protein